MRRRRKLAYLVMVVAGPEVSWSLTEKRWVERGEAAGRIASNCRVYSFRKARRIARGAVNRWPGAVVHILRLFRHKGQPRMQSFIVSARSSGSAARPVLR